MLIEKLFQNEKHLVWYRNYNELTELLKKYIQNDDKRKEIKESAYKLAKKKHTHINRIQNLLDIIMEKTEKFYGFLNG